MTTHGAARRGLYRAAPPHPRLVRLHRAKPNFVLDLNELYRSLQALQSKEVWPGLASDCAAAPERMGGVRLQGGLKFGWGKCSEGKAWGGRDWATAVMVKCSGTHVCGAVVSVKQTIALSGVGSGLCQSSKSTFWSSAHTGKAQPFRSRCECRRAPPCSRSTEKGVAASFGRNLALLPPRRPTHYPLGKLASATRGADLAPPRHTPLAAHSRLSARPRRERLCQRIFAARLLDVRRQQQAVHPHVGRLLVVCRQQRVNKGQRINSSRCLSQV